MRRSLTRIRTSHVGRLPPPKGWADMPARLAGAEITDPVVIAAKVTPAIAETVEKQIEAGIDCIGDGEFWTARNLAHYAAHFTGVEARPVAPDEPPTTRHSTRERGTATPGRILSVAARFPLYQTAAAHKAIEAGGKVGTVVIEPRL